MNDPLAYAYLAGALLAAVLLDFALVRVALELLKPPSMYAFLVGRLGKVVSTIALLFFVNKFWYPQYVSHGADPPEMLTWAETAIVVGMVLLALLTLPRAPRAERAG